MDSMHSKSKFYTPQFAHGGSGNDHNPSNFYVENCENKIEKNMLSLSNVTYNPDDSFWLCETEKGNKKVNKIKVMVFSQTPFSKYD